MKEDKPTPRTIFDESIYGFVILFLSGIIIGKFISPPLGSNLLVGCALYVACTLFFGAFILLFADFLAEDKKKQPSAETEQEKDSKGYLMYFAVAYILLWVVMFLIFPADTTFGAILRQWNFFN